MLASEKNLVLAVRNILRTATGSGGAGYTNAQCDVEIGDMVPPIAGDLYVAVHPGGWTKGPRHNSSGGVFDFVYSVKVTVIRRITHVPKDKTRDVYLNNSVNLAAEIDKIISVIDFNYSVMNAANALIQTETSSTQGFHHPLVFDNVTSEPEICGSEIFSGTREDRAGMKRTITFGMARRTTSRS